MISVPTRRVAALAVLLSALLAVTGCASTGSSEPNHSTSSSVSTVPDAPQLPAMPRLRPVVYRPPGLSRAHPVPLVVGFYGTDGSPQGMAGLTGFERLADRYGFVVLFPASVANPTPWMPRFNDFAYVKALMARVEHAQNIDPARIYAMGFSAGGNEVWQLGCALSSHVAAIAVVSYYMRPALYRACPISHPVSHLLIVGTADKLRYQGIPGKVPSAGDTTARWLALDRCPGPGRRRAVPPVIEQLWTNCAGGSAVVFYSVVGGGHRWPSTGGAPSSDPASRFDATPVIWAFFASHPASPPY